MVTTSSTSQTRGGDRSPRGKGAPHVAAPGTAVEAGLARGVAHAAQGDRVAAYAELARQRAGQKPSRVEAAGSQPARMQRHRNHQLRRRRRQACRRLEDQHARHGLRRRVEPREPGSRVLEAVDPRLDGPAELRRGHAGRERRGGERSPLQARKRPITGAAERAPRPASAARQPAQTGGPASRASPRSSSRTGALPGTG